MTDLNAETRRRLEALGSAFAWYFLRRGPPVLGEGWDDIKQAAPAGIVTCLILRADGHIAAKGRGDGREAAALAALEDFTAAAAAPTCAVCAIPMRSVVEHHEKAGPGSGGGAAHGQSGPVWRCRRCGRTKPRQPDAA